MQLPTGGSGVVTRNVPFDVVLCLTATTALTAVLQLLITSAVIQADGAGIPDLNKILCYF
jgi:hypothetical protein